MFLPGRRRRTPLLGAAVIAGTVGASRSAARSEVAKQEQRNREIQDAADRNEEMRRREEEERDRKTQLAIDEAIRKERSRTEEIESEQRKANTGETVRANRTINAVLPPSYDLTADGKGGTTIRYCSGCGNACKLGDRFCNKCGCKQPIDEVEQRLQ
jgi:hypothetical protein